MLFGGTGLLVWSFSVFMWVGMGSKVGFSFKISLLSCLIDWFMFRVGESGEGFAFCFRLVLFMILIFGNLGLNILSGGGRCVLGVCGSGFMFFWIVILLLVFRVGVIGILGWVCVRMELFVGLRLLSLAFLSGVKL